MRPKAESARDAIGLARQRRRDSKGLAADAHQSADSEMQAIEQCLLGHCAADPLRTNERGI